MPRSEGPWEVYNDQGDVGGPQGRVASVEVVDDAPLIAMAPRLLAFAKAVAEYDEYRDDFEEPRLILERLEARARAVVADAEIDFAEALKRTQARDAETRCKLDLEE